MGGDAYTGASGNTDGGDAITSQRNGLLNLNAANFGKNGGRAGQSTTGQATGGELTSGSTSTSTSTSVLPFLIQLHPHLGFEFPFGLN